MRIINIDPLKINYFQGPAVILPQGKPLLTAMIETSINNDSPLLTSISTINHQYQYQSINHHQSLTINIIIVF